LHELNEMSELHELHDLHDLRDLCDLCYLRYLRDLCELCDLREIDGDIGVYMTLFRKVWLSDYQSEWVEAPDLERLAPLKKIWGG
jgi:hypothetical protein